MNYSDIYTVCYDSLDVFKTQEIFIPGAIIQVKELSMSDMLLF